MTKKLLTIAGIILGAAMTAAALAYFLIGQTKLLDGWDLDIKDDVFDDDEI